MKELFNNLMSLADDVNSPFYFVDQERYGDIYRIFSYHYTDKSSWLFPDALEARGSMFEVDKEGNPIRIASRTMQKFFNVGEVDFIEYSGTPTLVMNKADGSLISTFLNSNGELCVKSKASIHSDYAELAMQYINDNPDLKSELFDYENQGFTVNMELVSPIPSFRIVIHYPETSLFILNIRNRNTGEYIDQKLINTNNRVSIHNPDVLNTLETDTGIEGYVVIDTNNVWWKLKTPWYTKRHKAKDFINQPLAFVELVLSEEADDVLLLVADQPYVLDELLTLQHKVITKANEIITKVTKYNNKNNELSRKDYAILGKTELDNIEFVLAMVCYANPVEPNWHQYFLKFIKKIEWSVKENE